MRPQLRQCRCKSLIGIRLPHCILHHASASPVPTQSSPETDASVAETAPDSLPATPSTPPPASIDTAVDPSAEDRTMLPISRANPPVVRRPSLFRARPSFPGLVPQCLRVTP